MALEKCRECGGQLSTKARFCPHCGAPNMLTVSRARVAIALAAGMLLLIAGVALLLLTQRPHA